MNKKMGKIYHNSKLDIIYVIDKYSKYTVMREKTHVNVNSVVSMTLDGNPNDMIHLENGPIHNEHSVYIGRV